MKIVRGIGGKGWKGKHNLNIASNRSGRDRVGKHGCTSFYFTNFPERYWAGDLYEVFSRHDKVHEVVIPRRMNAGGRRFGFVHFFDVTEPGRMETKLDNIFIENEKIHVNLPRFQREVPKDQRLSDPPEKQVKNIQQVWKQKKSPVLVQLG